MLAEMYQHLRDAFPSHGLEIVFVSSDRDVASFDRYYSTMPWTAIPFDDPSFHSLKQMLSMKYGVKGIPSLVVLDAMSGQVVVSAATSRKEVLEACHRGEEQIETLFHSWLDRLPLETKEMTSMLELSCTAISHDADLSADGALNLYLIRSDSSSSPPLKSNIPTKEETAAKVRTKYLKLVQEGNAPNVAAARAIEMAASGSLDNNDEDVQQHKRGPLDGLFRRQEISQGDWTNPSVVEDMHDRAVVISTLLKYVGNAVEAPWNPKFRHFKMSNRVADRITRTAGGIDLMKSYGLQIYGTDQDFFGSIPIGADLDELQGSLKKALEEKEYEERSALDSKK